MSAGGDGRGDEQEITTHVEPIFKFSETRAVYPSSQTFLASSPPHMQTRSQRRLPISGGAGRTLLAHAAAALLPFFSTREARALRLVGREWKAAVARHPWADRSTWINGSVAAWRASFPCAKVAKVSGFEYPDYRSAPIVDADFVHFAGLAELTMLSCTEVTDAAFAHLAGIRSLNMRGCRQITDAAFVHLKGIQELDMRSCSSITDAAFAHLKGIHALNMSFCDQDTITDAAFVNLKGIHALDMSYCNQATITDAVFAHLKGIHTLDMFFCNQGTITGSFIPLLAGINSIVVHGCNDATVAAARAAGLLFA